MILGRMWVAMMMRPAPAPRERSASFEIRHGAPRERLGPRHSGVGGSGRDDHHQDHRLKAGADQGHESEGQHDGGKGFEGVEDQQQRIVQPARPIARDQAGGHPQQQRKQRGAEGDAGGRSGCRRRPGRRGRARDCRLLEEMEFLARRLEAVDGGQCDGAVAGHHTPAKIATGRTATASTSWRPMAPRARSAAGGARSAGARRLPGRQPRRQRWRPCRTRGS